MDTSRFKLLLARILSVLLCTIVLLQLVCTFALAQNVEVPQVKENTYLYDLENVIDSDKEEEINSLLRYLEQKTSVEFAVITTLSFNNMSIEDYAHDLFNTLRIGKAGKDNGVLFLISVKEGHARLEIGYGLESLLTDNLCGQILDKYYVPNRDRGYYLDSITETVNGVLAVLGNEYNIEIVSNQESIVKAVKEGNSISTLAIILIIIAVLVIVVMLEVYCDGSSSSSSSSGGFFSSSSSSGGSFGGGFSGGGGASR